MATIGQLLAETWRLRLLQGLERMLGSAGYERIAGVDEAGRGSLAGPVVAAAVIIDPHLPIPGVDDSKRLTACERERLAPLIRRAALASAVVAVGAEDVDRLNVLEATRRAMKQALAALDPAPDLAVIDAVPLPGLPFSCLPLVRGDSLAFGVACASILAKVTRDHMMDGLAQRYPLYDFASNKGYGAPVHLEALRTYGPCPEHRLTFRSVLPRRGDGES